MSVALAVINHLDVGCGQSMTKPCFDKPSGRVAVDCRFHVGNRGITGYNRHQIAAGRPSVTFRWGIVGRGWIDMGVSMNGGTPKWLLYKGKSY